MATVNDSPSLAKLEEWVYECIGEKPRLSPVAGDASFRSYYRFMPQLSKNQELGESLIVMHAPPPQENCTMFVEVAKLFSSAGANVPRIHALDVDKGYVLLQDMGDLTYARAVAENHDSEILYGRAIETLVQIQSRVESECLPEYDEQFLLEEMRLFSTWYLDRHLKAQYDHQKLEENFALIVAKVIAQPQVAVHRDYHSRNLMVITSGNGGGQIEPAKTPGILDFQDALKGPISYDIVSLLHDAYIEWPSEKKLDWLIKYWEKAGAAGLPLSSDFSSFYLDFEWMSLQRLLKVMGIFARLYHRDCKDVYLGDIPLVFRYALEVANRYPELSYLSGLLRSIVEKTPG